MNDKLKNNSDYIRHILDAIGQIGWYIQSADLKEFRNNRMMFDAVVRQFEVIGEAARRIDMDFREKHPEIEWQKMVAMRNFLAHEYLGIDLDIIWDTANNRLPILKSLLLPLVKE